MCSDGCSSDHDGFGQVHPGPEICQHESAGSGFSVSWGSALGTEGQKDTRWGGRYLEYLLEFHLVCV